MKYTWQVEKYLEGELSGEELRNFELEILRNPKVAEEVERIRRMEKFMEKQHARFSGAGGLVEDYDDLENALPAQKLAEELEGLKIRKISSDRKKLGEFRARLSEAEEDRKLRARLGKKVLVKKISVWAVAASIFLLAATSSILLVTGRNSADHLSVYEQFYSAPPIDGPQRTGAQGEENRYSAALELYNEGKYAEALEAFNRIPEPVHVTSIYLYKGIAMMETGNYSEAIDQFRNLEEDAYLNHFGMWYTGLCYLAIGDKDNARSVFREIVREKGHYMTRSRDILKRF